MRNTQFILSQQFSFEEEGQRKVAFCAILTDYFCHTTEALFSDSPSVDPNSHQPPTCV